jgi:alkylation response protein AidB-like acyl-CoA dehydrogenase
MPSTTIPTRAELVHRAAETVPLLRSNAAWNEQHKRIHEENIEALADAGVFKMRIPVRYGGYESNASTMVEVLAQLGRGDGATAWNCAVWSISNWLACLFPDSVQDEVFATPDVRVCGVLSPTAMATPTDGGVSVDGEWHFMSGSMHSQWQCIVSMAPAPDGENLWPIMAMVPMSDLTVVDDWHTAGLKGTGSVTTIAQGVFIPEERVLPMVAVLAGQHASRINAEAEIYRTPMVPNGCTTFSGVALGIAQAAKESFLERLPARKITYTDYQSQREAPLTHHQVAEAAFKLDEAEFHAQRLAATVDVKNKEATEWKVEDRVGARAALGRTFRLAKESVDTLANASGGSSIYDGVPIQRIQRDMNTLNLHALMHPNTNFELYGRILCGVEPNTMYL